MCVLIKSTPTSSLPVPLLSLIAFYPPNFMDSLSFLNPLSPLSAVCMWVGGAPTGTWVAFWRTKFLKKISCLSLSSHQLSVIPQLGWDFMSPSPIHAGISGGLILCGSCTCGHSCFGLLSYLTNVSLPMFTPPGSYNLSSPSSAKISQPWKE